MSRSRPLASTTRRKPAVFGLLAFLLFAGPLLAWADSPAQREDKIKAALVFKLVKFVDWPAAAMPGKEPVHICALGDTPVGELLAAVNGKPVRDRVAQFRAVGSLAAADVRSCHVLYIAAGAKEIANGVPAHLRGRSLLTVSDAPDFTRRGGVIGLARGDNKINFEVNLRTARENSLELAAPLLELSTIVE